MTRTPPVMTQSLPIEDGQDMGVAASPPLSHPSGAEPVPVSGKVGIANAGHTPGPYWMHTVSSGAHHVCGRNGKILFRYAPDQEACALEHVRRLQKGYAASEKRIRDAAPLLLEALETTRDYIADVLAGHCVYPECPPASLIEQAEADLARIDAAISSARGGQ